jgi:hypothetical protein
MAYATLQDVRDFGITEDMLSDAKVLIMLEMYSEAIDSITGQWFEPRTLTIKVDGAGVDTLFLDVPIISISSLKINGDTIATPASDYTVYNSRSMPDDRKVPKIVLGAEGGHLAPRALRPIFVTGRRNQEVSGVFGYVDADGNTPALIKHALLLIIAEKVANPPVPGEYQEEKKGGMGPLIEEVTDSHSLKWGMPNQKAQKAGIASGISDDREVNKILLMFKRSQTRVSGRED